MHSPKTQEPGSSWPPTPTSPPSSKNGKANTETTPMMPAEKRAKALRTQHGCRCLAIRMNASWPWADEDWNLIFKKLFWDPMHRLYWMIQ